MLNEIEQKYRREQLVRQPIFTGEIFGKYSPLIMDHGTMVAQSTEVDEPMIHIRRLEKAIMVKSLVADRCDAEIFRLSSVNH